MNKHLQVLTGLALMIVFAACQRNKDTVLPALKATADKTEDTLQLGQSRTLSPKLSDTNNVRYQWLVNNTPAGATATFTFEAKERGTYRISFRASNAAGTDSVAYQIKVWGRYENGFYVLNEGWFGTETGSVFYSPYGVDTLTPWVHKKENPAAPLGGVMNTLQYGAIFQNKLYLVVKAGGPLIAADAFSLKETGRIEKPAGGDAVAFVGIDATRGLVSTGNGIYPINLQTFTLGDKLSGVTGMVGNMLKAGNYVFAHTAADGMVVLDVATYGVVKKPVKATIGFVQAKDGKVYGVKDSLLMSIDPQTLTLDSVKMKFKAVVPWGAWRSVSMAASTKDNNIFVVQPGKGWGYGNKLYRYVAGNTASLDVPFITLPDGQFFYGAGVAYDPHTDELVLTTINGEYTGNINRLLFYNANTGTLKRTVTYNGWYFPAMVVFQP